MNNILKFSFREGKREIFPTHKFSDNFRFEDNEASEAYLAHFISEIAEKNGLTKNDVMNIFPLVLRMLKSESEWAK